MIEIPPRLARPIAGQTQRVIVVLVSPDKLDGAAGSGDGLQPSPQVLFLGRVEPPPRRLPPERAGIARGCGTRPPRLPPDPRPPHLPARAYGNTRSEEHTSELQSLA